MSGGRTFILAVHAEDGRTGGGVNFFTNTAVLSTSLMVTSVDALIGTTANSSCRTYKVSKEKKSNPCGDAERNREKFTHFRIM